MPKQHTEIDLDHARELAGDVINSRKKRVTFFTSSPGVGKSALVQQMSAERNLKVLDVRLSSCDPTDLNGFPAVVDGKAQYIPMDMFPIESDPIPEGFAGWMIFLDEMPSAARAVQAAAYKLILDKMVGLFKLHKNVVLMAAGNHMSDKAMVNKLGTALQSRVIHLFLRADIKTFQIWAAANGIDHRVRSFLNWKPDLLHRFDPNHDDCTFPCPRTWEFLSDIIEAMPDIKMRKLPLLEGTVGKGAANDFYNYVQYFDKLPQLSDILANPAGLPMPDETGVQYALTGMIDHHLNANNADALMTFLRRMDIDMQVVTLRGIFRKNLQNRRIPSVSKWMQEHAEEFEEFN